MIDLIATGATGHNEGDEPFFTQPLMYAKIEAHPTVRKLWADTLIGRGVTNRRSREALTAEEDAGASGHLRVARPGKDLANYRPEFASAGDSPPRQDGDPG